MKRISSRIGLAAALAAAAMALMTALAGGAAAAKPASPGNSSKPGGANPQPPASNSTTAPGGKETVEIECEGLGKVTVSVPKPEKTKGAGQLVGQKGHGIPVWTSFTLTDVTTGKQLASETETSGHGHGHPHQATTLCKGTFEAPASEFFAGEGEELPPGVAPTDLIRGVFEARVIVKKQTKT
jgi:hypothetical protein